MPSLAPKKPRGPYATSQCSVPLVVELAPAIPCIEDLHYDILAAAFASNYAASVETGLLNVASRLSAVRIPAATTAQHNIGDFFPWPGREDTFACIVGFGPPGMVHVTAFVPRPQNTDAK